MLSLIAGGVLGALQGVRHAFEPDHLAAVSTVVAEQRSSRSSMRFAAVWGFGHALMLTAVGGTLFALRTEMPEHLADGFECVVAAMLVILGLRALRQATTARALGGKATSDAPHVHLSNRAARWATARRPLLIGVVHGLAGSGALAALVMAKLSSLVEAIAFMALYGSGAMLGMALLAGVAGAPLAKLAKTRRGIPALLASTGALSIVMGAVWGIAAMHHLVPIAAFARTP